MWKTKTNNSVSQNECPHFVRPPGIPLICKLGVDSQLSLKMRFQQH